MPSRNFQVCDRRRSAAVPAIPFRDSKGLIIVEDRRKMPDRRLNTVQAEWVNEFLLGS